MGPRRRSAGVAARRTGTSRCARPPGGSSRWPAQPVVAVEVAGRRALRCGRHSAACSSRARERGRGLMSSSLVPLLELARELGPERAMLVLRRRDWSPVYARVGFREIDAPVWVDQPEGRVQMRMRAMWGRSARGRRVAGGSRRRSRPALLRGRAPARLSASRACGNTDLDVFSLCLGGNVFGWTIDEQALVRGARRLRRRGRQLHRHRRHVRPPRRRRRRRPPSASSGAGSPPAATASSS